MNLQQIIERLAEIEVEVRNSTDIEAVKKLGEEKTELLEKRAELEKIEARALEGAKIDAGQIVPKVVEARGVTVAPQVEYRTAWLNAMRGVALSDAEQNLMVEKRAMTGEGYVIPDSTANMIVDQLVDTVPLLNEIELLRVKGNVSVAVQSVAPTVTKRKGGVAQAESDLTLLQIKLGSYTISSFVRVGADLASMAIDAFEKWLVDKIVEQLGYKIEDYIVNGTGSDEPAGLDKAFIGSAWVDKTDAIKATTSIGVTDLDAGIGLLPEAYDSQAMFVVSKKTFYTSIINLTDVNNFPVVTKEGNSFFLRGYPVKFSGKVGADVLFFGALKRGIVGNLSGEINVEKQRNLGYNSWDILGWGMFDCKPTKNGSIIKIALTL